MSGKIEPDYQFVQVDQTRFVGEEYLKARNITRVGTVYLIDLNLHVHICSATPCLEAFPMNGFVEFASREAEIKDEGNSEMELLDAEEPVTYFDLDVLRSPKESAAKYIPEREEDENDLTYRNRVADEVREYCAGNPIYIRE
jgi:hypothetical protein